MLCWSPQSFFRGLGDGSDAAINTFGDSLFRVTQQQAGFAQVVDLRRRFWSDVAELELGDSVGQLQLILYLGLDLGTWVRPPAKGYSRPIADTEALR